MNDMLSGKIENHDILHRKDSCMVKPENPRNLGSAIGAIGEVCRGMKMLIGFQVVVCLESKGLVIFGS